MHEIMQRIQDIDWQDDSGKGSPEPGEPILPIVLIIIGVALGTGAVVGGIFWFLLKNFWEGIS